MLRSLLFVVVSCLLAFTQARADIVINEVVTNASDRLLRYDAAGVPRIGTGPIWYTSAYNDSIWQNGPGPFGFGTTVPAGTAVGTNTQTRMQYLTPTLYLRKQFTVTAGQAALTDALELVVQYNDGFVVYVNGVEVARRWAGPPNQFVFHDMPAQDPDFNATTGDNALYSETVNLGAANTRLVEGENLIAVHALNISSIDTVFHFNGLVRIGGASPATLVNSNDTWKFFPGVAEPSGGLFDPTLLNSGRLNVPWGAVSFVDSSWSTGTAPIGQGVSGGTLSGVVGTTPSIYVRQVFTVSAAEAANTNALQLLADFDDGFVAYLNGVEVARANLQTPNTFVPRTAVSSATRNFGSNTPYTIDPNVAKLVAGTNVLAIQVHNVSISDSDVGIRATLQRASGTTYVAANSTWKYLIGTSEPVVDVDGAVEDNPDLPESVSDWIELHNNGTSAVSLNNWSLTDDDTDPLRWVFPDITIPAGEYLVVICDGADIKTPAPGGFLHANFSLSAKGEYLSLQNAAGSIIQRFNPMLPPVSAFYSYGRNGSGNYVYFDSPTPGAVNAGTESIGQAIAPAFSVLGGIYSSTQQVQLTSPTPGVSIRYTTDGSEPTPTTGFSYSGAISVAAQGGRNGLSIRARAFAPNYIQSDTVTQTYIVGANPAVTLPVVALTGDEGRSLYRPFGVFAIKNNAGANFPGGPWLGLGDPAQYNNANFRGQFMERSVNWSMLYPGAPGFSFDIGLRAAGSPFTRPRYILGPQNATSSPNNGVWTAQVDRPSMNFYMRDHYSGDPLDFPVIAGSPVTKHSDFRFRAGHNDLNPFVIDELMRRLHVDTGQQGSVGINVMLLVNGIYKNIYNLCQHVREEFLQEAFKSDLKWDVIQVNVPSDGDLIAFQEMFSAIRSIPNIPANQTARFQAAAQRVDLVNLIDYLLVNIYGCTGDWPQNNWIAARERSTTGKWRFFTWDAEGAFGSFGLTVISNNFTTSPAQNPIGGNQSALISTSPDTEAQSAAARILYTLLRGSDEFKLLFADRIQKHFFNSGALTDARIVARKDVLKTEASPLVSGFNDTRFNDWINGKGDTSRYTVTRNSSTPPGISATTNQPSRRAALFTGYMNEDSGGSIPLGFVPGHFVSEGVWPATQAPVFSQHGGAVAANFPLSITNPNGAGTIYYTIDGTDPRATGGAAVGIAYTAGSTITINQTLTIKARVLNGGVWSPVVDAAFVSAASAPLLITEIMYHPPDFNDAGTIVNGNEFEYLEIKNVGTDTYSLFGLKFTNGIEYAFPPGSTIAAGGFVVLAKNPAYFAKKYPNVSVLGGFGPSSSLNNAGETITLSDGNGNELFSVTYNDSAPWPVDADGNGYSLVPMLPNSNPAPSQASNWRLSGSVNGSPGADDPAPGIPQVKITEVLANSQAPAVDAVEIYNPTAGDADVSGWYLSDDLGTPKKYRIPNGTVIPSGGYVYFTETQFNTGPNAFAFSSNGDEAVLSSANAGGDLTGLTEFVSFGASDPGVAFGTHTVTKSAYSRTFFTALNSTTFGAANSKPKVGPVVISEVMYLPAGGAMEFVEILNTGVEPVPLYDPANPANTWRIKGINYTFPPGMVLQPRQYLIVSGPAPASLRSNYTIHAAVTIVGPFNPEELSNTGENITLQHPGTPFVNGSGQTVVPYIDVDAVSYTSSSPWPSVSSSRSLERSKILQYGEDPNSWRQSSLNGNPGRLAPTTFSGTSGWQGLYFDQEPTLQGHLVDPENDGLNNALEYFMGLNPRGKDSENAVVGGTITIGGQQYLTITFRQGLSLTPATTFVVEGSSNLIVWDNQTTQVGTTGNNGDGTQTVTFRDNVPISANTPRFLHLKVIVP